MTSALKPCPFCGGKAEFERTGTPRHSCIVRCTNCGCHHESSGENEHSGSAWNDRAIVTEVERTPEPSPLRLKLAHDLGKLVRKWHRLKEDKGDTEYHITKTVLQNSAEIIDALKCARSPQATQSDATIGGRADG